ncbi:hypothetical protein [Hydrogenoanaerobacterium sp.]|uniref:hypothetical protein n=1 Tax=Hydrogenoanaerobacterium sp. TaxID=2953763 RepID=UPI00289D2456|nr:hypothetical protein [Hydrogenoanaerobacterium sp.]
MAGTLQFNGFALRYNPRKIEIGYAKTIKMIDMPFSAPVIQELGTRPRIIKGEGELFGTDCTVQFEQLQAEFLHSGSGRLLCPLCSPMYAYFAALKVIGEAGPLLLRYAFEFVEDMNACTAAGAHSVMVNGRAVLPS